MSLQLSDGRLLTLSGALGDESNLLSLLHRSNKKAKLSELIWSQRATVEALCAHHLGLQKRQCIVQDQATWMSGQFNLCVLLLVTDVNGTTHKKIFRCPMSHRVAEESYSGSMDEKVRTEVANYAFAEKYCLEIPLPHLFRFGLSSDQQSTHERKLSWLPRWSSKLRRIFLSILRGQIQSPYARTSSNVAFSIPYSLLHFIDSDRGGMLSNTWKYHRNDSRRRKTLFQGSSRLMLSLARFPQPRIGCLGFMDDHSIALANPPLLSANTILESEGAPRTLHGPSSCFRSFLFSLLEFRSEALRIQPNAASDDMDCRNQMSYLILLEMLMPRLVDMDFKGPFVLQYTDLHASNLFVDDEWNIKGIIDLDFVCALPPSMLSVPYWLTVDYIDEVTDHLEEHDRHHAEFLQVLESEEKILKPAANLTLSHAIRTSWDSGEYWLWRCFTSVDALPSIMERALWRQYGFDPLYSKLEVFADCLSHFWSKSCAAFVKQKISDKARYDTDLTAYYHTALDSGNIVLQD